MPIIHVIKYFKINTYIIHRFNLYICTNIKYLTAKDVYIIISSDQETM